MDPLDYGTPPQRSGGGLRFWGAFAGGAFAGLIALHLLDSFLQGRRGSFSDGGILCYGPGSILIVLAILGIAELVTLRLQQTFGPLGSAVAGFIAPFLPMAMFLLLEGI
jgi:hypothetical protein